MLSSQPPTHAIHTGPVGLDDISYVAHFVKFGLKVINLSKDIFEPCDFSVGSSY